MNSQPSATAWMRPFELFRAAEQNGLASRIGAAFASSLLPQERKYRMQREPAGQRRRKTAATIFNTGPAQGIQPARKRHLSFRTRTHARNRLRLCPIRQPDPQTLLT